MPWDRVDVTRRRMAAQSPTVGRRMRRVVLASVAAVVGVLAVALGPALGVMVNAGLVDPNGPQPLNGLPSTVKGALYVGGAPSPIQQRVAAEVLYSYARNPAFWEAASAVNAGTATSSEIALVQSTNGSWQVPATKTATLTKVVGGVGTVIAGWSGGVALGAGALDAARTVGLIGFDPDGVVCQAVGTTFAGLFGADCTEFEALAAEFIPNTDAAMQTVFAPACQSVDGFEACLEHLGTATHVYSNQNVQKIGCVVLSGVVGSPYRYYHATVRDGVAGPWTSVWGTTGVSQFFPEDCVATFGVEPVYTLEDALIGDEDYPGSDASAWALCIRPTSSTSGIWSNLDNGCAAQMEGDWVESSVEQDDPLRQLECIIVASGQTFSAVSSTFRESEGVLPAPVCPDVPGGLVLESTEIRELNLDDGTWLTLWSETTTPEYQAAGTVAPECSTGTCLLDLRKSGTSCFQSPDACLDWFSDPNKESTYSCWYGTHAVDLSECTVYAPSFEPESIVTGETLGDPTTGEPLGAPAGASPGADGAAFGQTVQDPAGERECFPTGWAVLNPVEWVMRPVQCALEWAFVPRTQVVEQIATDTHAVWLGTLPGQGVEIMGGLAAALPEGVSSSCLGPPVTFPPPLDDFGMAGTWYPLNSCEEPMATVRNVAYWSLPAFTAFGLIFVFIRYLAGVLGFVEFGARSAETAERNASKVRWE